MHDQLKTYIKGEKNAGDCCGEWMYVTTFCAVPVLMRVQVLVHVVPLADARLGETVFSASGTSCMCTRARTRTRTPPRICWRPTALSLDRSL